MLARKSLFAGLFATALAGCTTVGPDFAPPQTPSQTGYLAPDDPPVPAEDGPVAVTGDGPVRQWWTVFGSDDLDRLVDRALAGNASLAASNATLAAARERVNAAAGKRLPQVDANARAEHEQINLAGAGLDPSTFPGIDGTPTLDLYSIGGGVSYDLDPFGKQRRGLEQVAARAESQARQTDAAHLAIAGRVVDQVFTIAAIRARKQVADALLAEDRRNVDLTRKRKQAGEGTLVEVLNAESQFQADRGDIPQLDQQLAEARHMLATLIGIAPADLGPTDFDIGDLKLPGEIPVTLPSKLVHKRPDILQAEAEFHAALAGVGVATARLYPDITLGATVEQGAPQLDDLFSSAFRGFDIFAGLTAPIFHGGTLKAEKRAAMAEARAAHATYRQTVLDSFRQVANLLDSLRSDARSVAQRQESAATARESLRLSRRSFQVGNTGILQILDSERLYQRSQQALVDARARQYLNVARLYVATAGGWTPDSARADTDVLADARP